MAIRSFALVLVLLACATAEAAGQAVARIATLRGEAFAMDTAGTTRTLAKDAPLHAEERIVTGRGARLFLRFTDDTLVALGPQTVFRVDAYRFDAAAASDPGEMAFSIFKGVARAVTGALAKREPRRVKFWTTVATIGIRGTHFIAEVDDTSAKIVLLEAEDPAAANAIEVANAYGRVEIDEAGYGTEIPDATSPPGPPRRMAIDGLQRTLRSHDTTRRVIVPRMPGR